MDLKEEFGVDKVLEQDGVWIPLDDVTQVKIARLGNKKYLNMMERLMNPHLRILNSKKKGLSVKKLELSNEIMCKVFAKTILYDWKDMFLGGKKVKYSPEECLRALTTYPEFRDRISDEADDINNFFKEEIEEIKENLK